MQLDAFVALNCSKLIVMRGIEVMKIIYIYIFLPISFTALAKARKFGLLILKLFV
jgi:hypothetical protein